MSNSNKKRTDELLTPISAPTLEPYAPAPNLTYTKYGDTTEGQAAYGTMNGLWEQINGYGNHNWANQDWYNQILQDIQTRPDFTYDFNQDALYQQYKDKYTKQAKMAMADTMGQASAMTGGYGSSYASTVGNQAYQASLENLNDIIPELYQMAYDRYNQKGQDLYNQAGLLMNDYNKSYGEWQDGYNMLVNKYGLASDNYYKGASLHGSEQDSINGILQQNWQNSADIVTKNNENIWKKAGWDEDNRRWVISDDQTERGLQLDEDKWDYQKKNNVVDNSGTVDNDYEAPIVEHKVDPNSTAITSFKNKLSPESAHDAIARQMYGPYEAYVAVMLESDNTLSEEEKAYLISYYGITETHLDYADQALKTGKRGKTTSEQEHGTNRHYYVPN